MEALIYAPADKAIPLVNKVLAGEYSVELKERALFVLGQIDSAEAHTTLMTYANDANAELQVEALRMIGISGNRDALANLAPIYENGDADVREAVLEAYMIAGDVEAVMAIAMNAAGEGFADAVDMLGAM